MKSREILYSYGVHVYCHSSMATGEVLKLSDIPPSEELAIEFQMYGVQSLLIFKTYIQLSHKDSRVLYNL